jgi:hypothetical protein
VALSAPEPVGRTVGADVLSQLGNQEGGTFVEQSVNALVAAAEVEQEPSVLRSIAFALGLRASPSGRRMLFSLAQHPSERVRFAVATGLWAVAIKDGDAVDDDPEAVSVHLDLMRAPTTRFAIGPPSGWVHSSPRTLLRSGPRSANAWTILTKGPARRPCAASPSGAMRSPSSPS